MSLEDPFWEELKAMAEEAGVPLARLVEAIDAGRGPANLSSALRLAVLDRLRAKLAAAERNGAPP